jgi:hypothetical protein
MFQWFSANRGGGGTNPKLPLTFFQSGQVSRAVPSIWSTVLESPDGNLAPCFTILMQASSLLNLLPDLLDHRLLDHPRRLC